MVSKKLAFLVMLLAMSMGATLSMQAATPPNTQNQGGVVSWPAPAGEKLFEDYTLRVNGQAVPVYVCRVSAVPFNQVWPGYQRPLDQTELAGFAYWEMSGPVQVEVNAKRPFKSVAVRPISRGIQPVGAGSAHQLSADRAGASDGRVGRPPSYLASVRRCAGGRSSQAKRSRSARA